jgi:putative MATE family efflux protein
MSTGKVPQKLTDMNVLSAIIKVAAPVVGAQAVMVVCESSALGMIGSLGAESLAAVGFSKNIFWWVTSWLWAVGMGVVALVSRAAGAGDIARAKRTLVQAILSGILVCTIVMILGLLFAGYALPLLGASPHVVALSVPYMHTLFISLPFMINFFFGLYALRAVGEAHFSLWLQSGVGVVQLILTRVLVFGWGPIPRLELVGGGLAFVLARVMGLAAVLWVLMSGKSILNIKLEDISLRLDWRTIKTLYKVSLPNALEWLGADTQKILILRIVASTASPTYAVSAFTVGKQVEDIYGTVGMGFATAAGALVGQNLGAGKPERSVESAVKTNLITTVIFICMGLIFVLVPVPVIRFFCDDPAVIELGTGYLRMLGLVAPAYAAALVFAGALRGAADTRSPMIVTLTGMWAFQLPLAYVLSLMTPMGLTGTYAAIGLYYVLQGAWLYRNFRSGRWMQISI